MNDNDDEIIKYYNNYYIVERIVNSNITCIKKINEHSDSITSLLILSDGRLASCTHDKTIKIYNLNNNYHCDLRIKTGHPYAVTYLTQLKNNKLVSCSFDQKIMIWNINQSSYTCDYSIKTAHNSYIFKVIPLTNNRMASCSWDKTIKIWNSNHPYKKIITLKGHTSYVRSIIQLKDREVTYKLCSLIVLILLILLISTICSINIL